MKKFVLCLCLLSVTALAGCDESKTIENKVVPCVGAFDEKDPNYVYKMSGWNVAMAIVFSELIVPPIVVLVDETFCPIRRREEVKNEP